MEEILPTCMLHQPFDAMGNGFAVGVHAELIANIIYEAQGEPRAFLI